MHLSELEKARLNAYKVKLRFKSKSAIKSISKTTKKQAIKAGTKLTISQGKHSMRLEKTTKAICENLEPVGAGALDSLVNNFTFGSVETIGKNKEVYGDDNRYYVGRLIADSAGIYLGVEGIVLGVGTEILGGALDLTGAGAPIGIQLNVAGIGIITGSATVVVNSGANFFQDAKDLSSNIEKGSNSSAPEIIKTGEKTPKGRSFSEHGAERANERGFSKETIDSIIDNNLKTRKSKVDEMGRKTWEYTDVRGNKVVTNESGGIVSVHSPAPGGNYIPKK
ncbi:hypothetical protein ATS86_002176 [Listeria monocytogenes]|nr:hypothetical protein [Listeria monocytogenes]